MNNAQQLEQLRQTLDAYRLEDGAEAETPKEFLADFGLFLVTTYSELPKRPEFTEELTETEVRILKAVAAGFHNHEIARAMNLAEGTIRNYFEIVKDKLGVKNRAEAAALAHWF